VVQPAQQVKPAVHPVQVPVGAAVPAVQATANGGQSPAVHQQAREPVPVPVARPPRTVTFDDNDDLDVPDFLK
jgi:cell division protein FtsZ